MTSDRASDCVWRLSLSAVTCIIYTYIHVYIYIYFIHIFIYNSYLPIRPEATYVYTYYIYTYILNVLHTYLHIIIIIMWTEAKPLRWQYVVVVRGTNDRDPQRLLTSTTYKSSNKKIKLNSVSIGRVKE